MPRRCRRWDRNGYPVFAVRQDCHDGFWRNFFGCWRLSYAAVFWSAAVTCAAAIPGMSTARAASTITYGLANYEDRQNGYSLIGSITTDGTIGVITASDIVAWQFTVKAPDRPGWLPGFSESGGPLAPFVLAQNSGTYLTTPGGLFEIAQPTTSTANVLLLGNVLGFVPIEWSRGPSEDAYLCMSMTSNLALWITFGSPLELQRGSTTWVIGSTSISPNGPVTAEPGSAVGLAMGMVGVGAVMTGRRWRRQSCRYNPDLLPLHRL